MNTTPHPPGFRAYDFGPLTADLLKPRASVSIAWGQ